jgi:hypothetical protein
MRGGAMNDYTLAVWEDWLGKQPPAILQAAERCPPWGIYQFRNPAFARLDGLLCTVACYETDGSLTVRFTHQYGPEILLSSVTPEQLYFTPPHGQVN